jgi:hypothetical protein
LYNGLITTDNAGQGGGYKWMSPSKVVYAGGDIVLASPAQKLDTFIKTSNEGISAMKTATKHILYTIASAYLHRLEAAKVGTNTFIPIYIVLNIVLFSGAVGCLIAEGVSVGLYFKKKKKITQTDSQQRTTNAIKFVFKKNKISLFFLHKTKSFTRIFKDLFLLSA